jgi:uncharacterized protein (DUF2252 family)
MSKIRQRLDKVLDTLNDKTISKEAYNFFHDITPERSGYAKSQTKLKGNTIDANYPYAGVLDKGRHMTNRGMRGSTQAPKGMSKPTYQHIRDYVYKKLGVRI